MKSTLTADQLVRAHGLDNIVYFPQHTGTPLEPATAAFLSAVGIPNMRLFKTRADIGLEDPDPVELGALFDLEDDDFDCPAERRHWQTLGYLRTTLIVIDPDSGAVHGYPEGEEDSLPLHRDVESLAYCLTEFRKLQDAHAHKDNTEVIVHHFREAVTAFDATPLEDDESEWNTILDEILDGIW
ncbi:MULTISPECIES: SUKH-4 family immunity protein [unclassified Streptomyces]|uniref:SUKH-4 family immunity protein n=1 Tax=unclassified Streptomyces TaxID=2593676 RepID=UPI002DD7FE40|nr:SUKH-4 family immunity protein [Streptomyces sp. NBC_01445]WSE02075.1 SUKH-4 family immunity protein [Streptomyces sp. NBC_01445]WSE10255.1 SUKH-4 family immunity protein [Streptomyces sp. NBC_01445]WSE11176.1 SUKH-4 family immunity protein [Streptomyces sp. NBC_01445]